MSEPENGFITCQCVTGRIEEDGVSRNCPICDGDPRITLETVKEYANQVDSFSKENAELRSAYQRSRGHSCRLKKRVEELEQEKSDLVNLYEVTEKLQHDNASALEAKVKELEQQSAYMQKLASDHRDELETKLQSARELAEYVVSAAYADTLRGVPYPEQVALTLAREFLEKVK